METQVPKTTERRNEEHEDSWDSRDENTVVNTDDTLVPGAAASMSSDEKEWISRDERTTVDTTDEDRTTFSREEAWRVTHQELSRCEAVAGHLEHFVIGGELVRRLNGAGKFLTQGADCRYRPEEYSTTWNWDALQTNLEALMYSLVEKVLEISQEAGYPRAGIIMIMDTNLVKNDSLEELQEMLFNIRNRVDAHNMEHGTNYYVMVALCLYPEVQRYRHSDAQIASANAMFCEFNSFLG